MDTAAPSQAPATDDQELAKVLESMNSSLTTGPSGPVTAPDEPADTVPEDATPASGLEFETTPAPTANPDPTMPPEPPVVPDEPTPPTIVIDSPPAPATLPDAAVQPPSELDTIKKEAVSELRPLVDKLSLPAQEKFDTLLLIIRSTDDRSLVAQTYEAARAIEDDTKRAEALLDVIKEIDYFSHG